MASTGEPKKPIQILRDRRGGVPKDLVERHGARQGIRKKISAALKEGPRTVPELAGATGVPGDIVLWHVMSMKKYGKVVEAEEDGSYYRYALRKEEK